MDDLKALEIWCMTQVDFMDDMITNSRFMSRHRKQSIKGQIVGLTKVINQIRRMQKVDEKKCCEF